jgi:uncharacterized protein (TIGR02186 family)
MKLLFAIAAGVLILAAGPAQAEKLVSTLSNTTIQVATSFAGETLTLFGNIEPDTGSGEQFVTGPFHVIVVVEGPLTKRVARRKTNVAGMWINTQQVVFDNFPSYFKVVASDNLEDIADEATLAIENIDPASQARHSAVAGWWDSVVFGQALVRLMTEKGLYGVSEGGVRFLSDTAYSAQVILPNDVPNGSFIARTYVFKDGAVVARTADGFVVRKIGFERFIFDAANQYPLIYGFVCVLLAIGTGWLGGVIFRR